MEKQTQIGKITINQMQYIAEILKLENWTIVYNVLNEANKLN